MMIYSPRRLFTGLVNAAFMAWKLTVAIAIKTVMAAVITNTQILIGTRYE